MKSRYFSKASGYANDNFSNYSGGWNNLTMDKFMNADASINAGVGASEPLNFQVANGGTTNISDVVLLGAYENTATGVPNYGNDANITITMDNAGTTYAMYLESLKAQYFSVGQIYLSSSNSSQLTKTLTVQYRESQGKTTQLPIFPKLDPMQNLTTALNVWTQFPVDGYTKISFTVLASTTVTISLYPMAVIDQANQLVGKASQTAFRAPNLSQFRIG